MLRSIVGSLLIGSLMLAQQAYASSLVIQVVDASNFCTFLPPSDSTDRSISDSESEAQAFCLGSAPSATGSVAIPTDFIQSAHYAATDNYVQVTGQIDPTKANLDLTDGGGQYDIKAPNGASCVGWDYFVNLVEPDSHTYCVRCCNNSADCNRGKSEAGCVNIVPGDYTGPLAAGSVTASTTATSSAAAATFSSFVSASPSSLASSSSSSSFSSSPSASANFSNSVSGSTTNSQQTDAVTDQSISGTGFTRPTFAVLAAVILGTVALF